MLEKTFQRNLFQFSVFSCLGATLEIITDRSQEGAQFCKGFGGIGGMPPPPPDFPALFGHLCLLRALLGFYLSLRAA